MRPIYEVGVSLAALITLLISVSLAVTIRGYPRQLRNSLMLWARGTAWLPLAWLLMGFARFRDNAPALVLGSAVFALVAVDYGRALRRFFDRRPQRVADASLIAAVALATLAFAWIWPSYQLRVVANSALLGLLHARVAAAALAGGERPRPVSHWLTASVFALGATVLVLRAAYELTQPSAGAVLFVDAPTQAVLFGVAALLPLVATFGFMLMCNDRFNQELLRLASFDPLTGAYNRRSTEETARRAVDDSHERGAALSVVLLDVDHFKRINDELGHAAGDKALQSIVEALRRALPQGAVFGRMGGEEFMVVLPGADAPAALAVAETLRAAVEAAPLKLGERVVPMTISLGVAGLALGAADDFDALSARADHAMYAAKRGGRNRVAAADAI